MSLFDPSYRYFFLLSRVSLPCASLLFLFLLIANSPRWSSFPSHIESKSIAPFLFCGTIFCFDTRVALYTFTISKRARRAPDSHKADDKSESNSEEICPFYIQSVGMSVTVVRNLSPDANSVDIIVVNFD